MHREVGRAKDLPAPRYLHTYMYSAVMQNVLNMLSLKIASLFLVYLIYFGIELSSVLSVTGRIVQMTIYYTRFHFHLNVVLKNVTV